MFICWRWALCFSCTHQKRTSLVFTLLISGQQHAACKDMVSPPDRGHRRLPSVSLCIIAFPLPQVTYRSTRPPSLFIKNVITFLFARVKTNRTCCGGWTGGCSSYLCQKNPASLSYYNASASYSVALPSNVILRNLLECDRVGLRLVYSGGKCDFS